jgi:hypothetical protein
LICAFSTRSAPLLVFAAVVPLAAAASPTVGDKAPDFALTTVEGKSVRLSEAISQGPVVLVVLRGYPGYQCPFCNRQVQDFLQKSQAFVEAGARVVMVYPGPPQDLRLRAMEFWQTKNSRKISTCYWTLATSSPICTGFVGTRRTKRHIHPPS